MKQTVNERAFNKDLCLISDLHICSHNYDNNFLHGLICLTPLLKACTKDGGSQYWSFVLPVQPCFLGLLGALRVPITTEDTGC
jgi:hypothetical protein